MKRKSGTLNQLRFRLEFLLIQTLTLALRPLSARSVYRLARAIGGALAALPDKRRKYGLLNLDIAFGDAKPSFEKKRIYKESVIQVTLSTLQCLWLRHDTEARTQSLIPHPPEGLEVVKECLERGKGILFLTAHYGNWEVMGLKHGYLNLARLHPIVRRLDNPFLEKAAADLRTRSGNHLLYRDESPVKIFRALKDNEAVAVMMDQNTAIGGVFVDFFGKKAGSPTGAARLSLSSGAAVIPLFCYPQKDGSYRVQYGPELRIDKGGDKKEAILNGAQECQNYIEAEIRKQPEAWMWIHRRWKTRPREETTGRFY
ncbi:MAG: lysophospholipid acyltransferase family protein [Candidatus Nitrohelix vancouverensis]|uniref:Lysophospholipid acyltransferase family protein n=1 Tax=Candidatus Nitrohelix vancouverensis TaxID=2705534 RepID=A0A7T0C2Z9_9BACT|nr:MAG: lysophospholipid acyltransferase family protein [Candidatus Nitrohelix vancouverensis]